MDIRASESSTTWPMKTNPVIYWCIRPIQFYESAMVNGYKAKYMLLSSIRERSNRQQCAHTQ